MRTVLIVTTGMSPAVLTETVWALAQELPAVIPDDIVVITTVSGRQKIEEQLFGQEQVWESLRASLLPRTDAEHDTRLSFALSDIVVARKKVGGKKVALDTLSEIADHTAFADTIMDELWKYTSQPDTRVIGSLAGGFKTMSALMLSTMQLLANTGDRLTHVLVPDAVARDAAFFYPRTKKEARLVQLIDIPLIPLRHWFAKHLNRKPPDYTSLVNASLDELQKQMANLKLEISSPLKKPFWMKINGVEYKLTVHQFGYLRCMAEYAHEEIPVERIADLVENLQDWATHTAEDNFELVAFAETVNREDDQGKLTFTCEILQRRLSGLKTKFPELLPVLPGRGNWNLAVSPESITLH